SCVPTALSVRNTRMSRRVRPRIAWYMSIHASMPSRDPSSARGGRSSAAITVFPELSATANDIGKYCIGVTDGRRYLLERIDDAAVVQIYADSFAMLPLRDKRLVWHLYLAALAGRDIYYDQRHALNLEIRGMLETLLHYGASIEPRVLAELRRYTKLFWINTGPFNNLTARKFV